MSRRNKIIIGFILVLVIAIPVGLYIAGNIYYSPERNYEENWNIELPDNMKERFDTKDVESFHNDGIRYTIYDLKEQSEFFDDFKTEKSISFENDFRENLSVLNLSNAEQPNWNNDYLWKEINQYSNHLYMVLDTTTNTLFITQKLQ